MIAASTGLVVSGPVQPSHVAVLAPALGAVLALVLARRNSRGAYLLTLLGAFVSVAACAVLVAQFFDGTAQPEPRTIGRLALGGTIDIPLRLKVDHTSVLLAVTVGLVAFVVQIFARWYLYNDPRYRSFARTVALFTSAMMLLVLSGDVVLTIVGWEVMGWCSYLLIGHESDRRAARAAAHKAYLVTRIADAPFVVGMAALASVAGSTSWDRISTPQLADTHPATVTGALLCIVIGVAGKSAQVPFQDWLPDAMEGPTPASALIHAATMVAAGTVVLARLLPLLATSGPARWLLVLSAGVSAVLGGLLAFAQQDLKKLLAWSTVSQVGIMLLAIAVQRPAGTGDAAVLQLVGHASFKALLFLMFGWLAVLAGSTRAERLSGVVIRYRNTRRLTAIGLLALAAVPPTVGFFAKDVVIDQAVRSARAGDLVAVVGAICVAVTVFLTAAYAMRAWLIVSRRTISEYHEEIDVLEDSYAVEDVPLVQLLEEAPLVDTDGREITPGYEEQDLVEAEAPAPTESGRFGLWILALATLFSGGVVFTSLLDLDWQHPDIFLTASALLLMLAAALLVTMRSVGTVHGDAAARLPMWLRGKASRGLDLGEPYRTLVARPVLALAEIARRADNQIGRGVDGLGSGATRVGTDLGRIHRRRPADGLFAIAVGLLCVGVMAVALW